MREFKYDVVKLINAVRDRPCLWDKTLENYRDRLERKAAWEEVFDILDEDYNKVSSEDRRLTAESIVCKWTNIRDTFVKSLKTRLGKPKRKYIYHDLLKFLIKSSDYPDYDDSSYVKEEPPKRSPRKRSKKKSEPEIKNDEEIVFHSESEEETVVVDDSRIMNEDEAFFASLLPTVVKYSEDERLEFRLEVLAVMKKIKEKRKWSSNTT